MESCYRPLKYFALCFSMLKFTAMPCHLHNTAANCIVKFCVADTRHLHSEPDPTFYFDSDPEINFYYILIQKQMFLFIWIK